MMECMIAMLSFIFKFKPISRSLHIQRCMVQNTKRQNMSTISMSSAKPRLLFHLRNVLLKARNSFPNLDMLLPKYNNCEKTQI